MCFQSSLITIATPDDAQSLFILFIDYEKAYDNVNRDKLWEMMDNNIPNYLLKTIKCIYRDTKVRIKFNDGISEPLHINKDVRQGSGLSPVLFNIYINKTIQEISEHCTICR